MCRLRYKQQQHQQQQLRQDRAFSRNSYLLRVWYIYIYCCCTSTYFKLCVHIHRWVSSSGWRRSLRWKPDEQITSETIFWLVCQLECALCAIIDTTTYSLVLHVKLLVILLWDITTNYYHRCCELHSVRSSCLICMKNVQFPWGFHRWGMKEAFLYRG